ncbi:MAG: hypothetical protein Q7K34_03090 [archaeon]|nr:hypothetical protein [archaeon]
MIKVVHRVTTAKELGNIPKEYAVEIDLRDYGKHIILNHDPFKGGELFEEYCTNYNHSLMVLNVKSEGIEEKVLDTIKQHGIKNYFFLDITFPTMLKLSKKGEKNIAVRFSEYEPLENALRLKNKINWVWIDTFTKLPISKTEYSLIKKAGFKTFLVSPDRWERPKDIEKYSNYLHKNKIRIDAVMSSLELIKKWD